MLTHKLSLSLPLIVAWLEAQFSFCRASVLWDLTELGVIVDCHSLYSLTTQDNFAAVSDERSAVCITV